MSEESNPPVELPPHLSVFPVENEINTIVFFLRHNSTNFSSEKSNVFIYQDHHYISVKKVFIPEGIVFTCVKI